MDDKIGAVVSKLQQRLGDDYEVRIVDVTKNNDTVKKGISVRKNGEKIGRIYYWNGEALEAFLGDVESSPLPDIDFEMSLKKQKDNIVAILINAEANKERLKDMPHRMVEGLDLAVVYKIIFKKDSEVITSSDINNGMMAMLRVTEGELYTIAMKNTKEYYAPDIKSMTETLVFNGDLRDYYAIWAHQIKTPISAIDVLLQAENEPDKIDLKELKRQLFNIDFYVDAVMNYLRLEDMSSDYVFEDCQVEKIVRKAVKKFAAQFIGKKISIELNNLDTNVKTDEKWLGFIIEQLISNAVKYTRNGGKISIYMKETFNSADRILVIEDNGIGITKEDIPRIFERGYTGYNGRMSKKSSGIGLYLCRKAADKLGISIAIESKLDKGTKVLLDMTQKYISHE